MKKLKVLIADDSVIYRSQIRAALSELPWIETMGVASNGRLALDRIEQIPLDLLILDLEMPELDGLQTLLEINRRGIKCKVLVFSSGSKKGATITLEALKLGAADFILKPGARDGELSEAQGLSPSAKIKNALEPKILALFPEFQNQPKSNLVSNQTASGTAHPTHLSSGLWDLFQPKVIVIGASTGGPTVLEKIFSEITGPLRCPILITQHMPPVFTAMLAERLEKKSGIPTFEAKHLQQVNQNAVYIAPGNFHMTLEGTPTNLNIVLNQEPLINSVRPAVDPLFASAASIFKEKCMAIVLTGMGADGRVGAERVKESGGVVLIQNEESCVVFGMPGAVMAAGYYDRVLSPNELIKVLCEKTAFAQKLIGEAV